MRLPHFRSSRNAFITIAIVGGPAVQERSGQQQLTTREGPTSPGLRMHRGRRLIVGFAVGHPAGTALLAA